MSKIPDKAPKLTCCESKPKCARCPLRYLKADVLPEGITVKKRRVVNAEGRPLKKKEIDRVWRRAKRRSR